MAITHIGFFSNINQAGFKWKSTVDEQSYSLDDVSQDGSNYKVVGYPYNYLHANGVVANDVQGYKFAGWYTLNSNQPTVSWYQFTRSMLSASALSTSASYVPNDATLKYFKATNDPYYLLYAAYEKTFTVTFNPNGGNTPVPTSKTVENSSQYGELATCTRSGYDFDGWFTSSVGGTKIEPSTTVSLSTDQTLYAHWKEKKKNYIVFDPNGGDPVSGSVYKILYDGDVFGQLPTTTRSDYPQWMHYTFDGWYTERESGTRITESTVYHESLGVRMYAHWNETDSRVTITFNPTVGVVSPLSAKYMPGAPYGTLPTPIATDYDFTGWYNYQGAVVLPTDNVPSSNATLKAGWSAVQGAITVRYTNPMTGVTEDRTTYSSLIPILKITEVFPDWVNPTGTYIDTQSAWIDSETGKTYAENMQYSRPSKPILILSINISSLKHTVTFNPNGGTVTPSTKTVHHRQSIGVLPTPTLTGKYFNGWFTAKTGGSLVQNDYIVTSDSIVLYAQWRDSKAIPW